MADEDPYHAPPVDESKWFSGGHLGGATQQINWQIVNCTTPANYFHVLRRQVGRPHSQPKCTAAPIKTTMSRNLIIILVEAIWNGPFSEMVVLCALRLTNPQS